MQERRFLTKIGLLLTAIVLSGCHGKSEDTRKITSAFLEVHNMGAALNSILPARWSNDPHTETPNKEEEKSRLIVRRGLAWTVAISTLVSAGRPTIFLERIFNNSLVPCSLFRAEKSIFESSSLTTDAWPPVGDKPPPPNA